MIKPYYDKADRYWMRHFPDSTMSKMMFLELRKKHLQREFCRIFTRLKKAFKK